MKATIRFDLSDPADARQHRYALAGLDALLAPEEIDQWARGIVKHTEPTPEVRRELEHLRKHLIPHDLIGLMQ